MHRDQDVAQRTKIDAADVRQGLVVDAYRDAPLEFNPLGVGLRPACTIRPRLAGRVLRYGRENRRRDHDAAQLTGADAGTVGNRQVDPGEPVVVGSALAKRGPVAVLHKEADQQGHAPWLHTSKWAAVVAKFVGVNACQAHMTVVGQHDRVPVDDGRGTADPAVAAAM